ncbi:MAG: major capsid protein [Microviridae sp.]|nr:MAG: major capsid protein [Microviridae sp.]
MGISPSWSNVGASRGHTFANTPQANIRRSVFDRSHGLKTAFDSGYLIPVYVDEVIPGDTFNLKGSFFGRLSTPVVPIIDNIYMDSFFFFVPYRLIWDNFKKMMGEQANPADSISYSAPTFSVSAGDFAPGGKVTTGTLMDYMGIPANLTWGAQGIAINSLAARAYNKIWNEWFRDENLQNSVTVDTGDGPDASASYVLLKRGKRHDYFTSCLPWPQKGTAVSLPLGTSAPVAHAGAVTDRVGVVSTTQSNAVKGMYTSANNVLLDSVTVTNGLYADLSTATAATINALRLAFQTQALLERDARGGTRYTEIVRSHFGVVSPDARLQRTEYLGGGSTPINISPIPQTSATGATGTVQGNLAAMGTLAASGHGFVKSFTEHGLILGLVSVRADMTYQQGVEKMWTRQTRYDWYWPSFAQIGEQPVYLKELYALGTTANDTTVFGYQERYGEMRYKQSKITGKLNSLAATPLDNWHLAQKFASAPTLGDTFIKETPPIDRIVAVTTEPQIILDAHFNLKCARPMPVQGTPFSLAKL